MTLKHESNRPAIEAPAARPARCPREGRLMDGSRARPADVPVDAAATGPEPRGPRRILVVDDDAATRMLMRVALINAGFEVETAVDGDDALQNFRRSPSDMVLLDVDMPGRSGHEVCAALRAHAGELLPIVMVTGMDDVESVEKAYHAGATDFIAKPINWALIGHRVKYLYRGFENLTELQAAERKIRQLAYFDTLTGLPNRQSFLDRVERDIGRARADGTQLAVLFMDLDGFKNINDTMGHSSGDRILQMVADRLREELRAERPRPSRRRRRPAGRTGIRAPRRRRVHGAGVRHRAARGRAWRSRTAYARRCAGRFAWTNARSPRRRASASRSTRPTAATP